MGGLGEGCKKTYSQQVSYIVKLALSGDFISFHRVRNNAMVKLLPSLSSSFHAKSTILLT